VPSGDVPEAEIAGERAEERNALSEKDGDAGNGEVLDETRTQEALYGNATINIKMLGSGGGESGDDLGRWTGHLFDRILGDTGQSGEIEGRAAKDDDPLRVIGPGWDETEDGFESLAAHDDCVDLGDELFKAMGFAVPGREEVKASIWPRNEAIDAGSNKDRGFHSANLVFAVRAVKNFYQLVKRGSAKNGGLLNSKVTKGFGPAEASVIVKGDVDGLVVQVPDADGKSAKLGSQE
jgi:hypothetical protein